MARQYQYHIGLAARARRAFKRMGIIGMYLKHRINAS